MASASNLPAIRACLFDMDGLLLDSEDKYTIATNEVLREFGKPDLPWHIKAQMQGRPAPFSGDILFEWAQLSEKISREDYVKKVSASQKRHFPSCQPLPGVEALLQTLSSRTAPAIEIALATSSHSSNFKLKTDHLTDLFSVFSQEHRILGDDPRIPKGRGKPAPDIYLLALDTINERLRKEKQPEIKPEECLVFEDSVPGVESGRRAGMQVVWCPHPGLLQEYRGREEEVLAGLTGEYKDLTQPSTSEGTSSGTQNKPSAGATGQIGDRYARLIPTLENFPYESYGIRVQDQGAKRASHV